jgi:hypothetical protein
MFSLCGAAEIALFMPSIAAVCGGQESVEQTVARYQ